MQKPLPTIVTFIGTLAVVIGAIVWYRNQTMPDNPEPPVVTVPTEQPIMMCYTYYKETSSGFSDRAWLKMAITGANRDEVTGEYHNLPAQKDSKYGPFSGTVGPMDPKISARTANVMWDSMAEGMYVTEELTLVFGEGSAVAQFGEMIDRGDGVYVYRDRTKLTPGFQMSQIDCEALDDIVIVGKYVRNTIKTWAPVQPVLGGSWYVTNVQILPATKTGIVTYEDGHIMGTATFNYTRDVSEVVITNVVKIK